MSIILNLLEFKSLQNHQSINLSVQFWFLTSHSNHPLIIHWLGIK